MTEYVSSPRMRRVAVEEAFGEKLSAAFHQAAKDCAGGVKALVARAGLDRGKIYKSFANEWRMHAAHLWLLPPEVLRPLVEDLATVCGLEVRPVGERDSSAVTNALKECADVVRGVAEALANDGVIDATEAAGLRSEVVEAQEALAALDGELREVLKSRGVVSIGGGK